MWCVAFDVDVMHIGNDWQFHSDGWLFVLQCGMYTVDCLRTNDKLLCVVDVIIKNLLAHDVVVIVLARRSEVVLT